MPFKVTWMDLQGVSGGSAVKNPSVNAGDAGSIPGSGRSPGGRNGNHPRVLAWKISWTEKLGGLQSAGSQRIRKN